MDWQMWRKDKERRSELRPLDRFQERVAEDDFGWKWHETMMIERRRNQPSRWTHRNVPSWDHYDNRGRDRDARSYPSRNSSHSQRWYRDHSEQDWPIQERWYQGQSYRSDRGPYHGSAHSRGRPQDYQDRSYDGRSSGWNASSRTGSSRSWDQHDDYRYHGSYANSHWSRR